MSFEILLLGFRPLLETLHEFFKWNYGSFVFAVFNRENIRRILARLFDVDLEQHALKKLTHRDSMIFCIETHELCCRPIEPNFHN